MVDELGDKPVYNSSRLQYVCQLYFCITKRVKTLVYGVNVSLQQMKGTYHKCTLKNEVVSF